MRQLVNPLTFGRPCIGLARFGCTNRPFYQITVYPDRALGRHYEGNKLEDLGSFDPLPNDRNEKLVAIKFDRLKYWMGVRNAYVSTPVLELLGLSGLLPIHPKTILRARMYRQKIAEAYEAGQWQQKMAGGAQQKAAAVDTSGDDQQSSEEATNDDEEKETLVEEQRLEEKANEEVPEIDGMKPAEEVNAVVENDQANSSQP